MLKKALAFASASSLCQRADIQKVTITFCLQSQSVFMGKRIVAHASHHDGREMKIKWQPQKGQLAQDMHTNKHSRRSMEFS
ncbi:hypothetical protein CEXT_561111 [Caerostris extrusa]|uniref:Uncharacterized protein n=1 Tax=Caerostris extrusa TaxID=172846 RepID=A0AAV4N880_CAEEX|nr:hypothetical protein CEXT_561111 [Caerostris extrusa]